MSWFFSQALVAEYSAAISSAGAPSAPLSVMPTPHRFWRNDKPMDCSRLSRFGLTCAVLTADHGEALLTWFREGFLARTSRPRAMVWASMAHALDCGDRWHVLPTRYDRATSSWRTHRCLWEEVLPSCSVTLPKWGMTRSGVLSERLTSPPRISGIESGSLQRTARRRWPTPVASMAKGSSPAALTRRSGANRTNYRLDHAVMALDGGHLNPDWAEWLMGWPTGWTDLKPLATDRFQSWQRAHSSYFATDNNQEAA
ncbi:hypothetical protein PS664_00731 [Pseudomonas fluorescens]|nr:hypothetical protein PS664_00731 [Pseudomonas fluorescens]